MSKVMLVLFHGCLCFAAIQGCAGNKPTEAPRSMSCSTGCCCDLGDNSVGGRYQCLARPSCSDLQGTCLPAGGNQCQ